jgi:hypothetical protein
MTPLTILLVWLLAGLIISLVLGRLLKANSESYPHAPE